MILCVSRMVLSLINQTFVVPKLNVGAGSLSSVIQVPVPSSASWFWAQGKRFSNFLFSVEFQYLSSNNSILSAVLVFQALFLAKVSHSFLSERVKSFTFMVSSVFPNVKIIIYTKYYFLLFACIFAWKTSILCH